jgi:hypothetical protein
MVSTPSRPVVRSSSATMFSIACARAPGSELEKSALVGSSTITSQSALATPVASTAYEG